MKARRRTGAIATLAMALLASQPATAEKARTVVYPPYVRAYEPQTRDERGLWMEADEAERQLRDSAFVVHDETLNTYLHSVLCRAVGDERCAGVRIYLVRVPALNATMAPNGAMVVWTGALLRIHSEAELAAVLAHEFAHFEKRHSLQSFAHRRSVSDVMAWVGIATAAAVTVGSYGRYGSRSYGGNINVVLLGSVFAFDRAQEQEADMTAASYLAASPYRVGSFADLWGRVMDESDATAIGRGRRIQRYDNVSFFATHPTDLQRTTYLRGLAANDPAGGIDGTAEYVEHVRGIMPSLIADQLALNDFGGSEYLLTQLARANGWSAELLYARAELYRTRGNPRDLVTAAGFYRDASQQPNAGPEVWRGLGLCLLRSGSATDGQAALREYLRRAPNATDRQMITVLAGAS